MLIIGGQLAHNVLFPGGVTQGKYGLGIHVPGTTFNIMERNVTFQIPDNENTVTRDFFFQGFNLVPQGTALRFFHQCIPQLGAGSWNTGAAVFYIRPPEGFI